MTRIVHLIAHFTAYEAMGRTIVETATRVPGEHHLVTTGASDGAEHFHAVHTLGGPIASFPFGRMTDLADTLGRIQPDLVHLHAGALGPLQLALPVLRPFTTVLTMYAWPTVPAPATWRRARYSEVRASNVLRPRVALTTLLPPAVAAAALRRSGTRQVLTPDPRVAERLSGYRDLTVTRLSSGAPSDTRRAEFAADRPVIVFAGGAETVRGIDTLLDAFPIVRQWVPGAVLRLLLVPRPELASIVDRIAVANRHPDVDGAIEVVTEPLRDLLGEFAAAQVGTWPFKFDYTTAPPAMAVAEAMSVGLPVVATDVGCVRAVLEPGVNGVAVPPAQPVKLAAAIVRLLRDKDSWQRYADAGVTSVRERLGWARAAEATAHAYTTAMLDRPSGRPPHDRPPLDHLPLDHPPLDHPPHDHPSDHPPHDHPPLDRPPGR
jgi:starch synthase